jgi:hypothetical protein
MANKIDTVISRNKLTIRREPYWQRISKGFHIGFRKMSEGAGETWHVRHGDESGHEIQLSLGALDSWPQHARFDRAVEVARELLSRRVHGACDLAPPSPTVMDACNAYVRRIHELKGSRPARDLQARYKRWVEPDPLHKIELAKLSREDLDNFRRRLVASPVKRNTAGVLRERSKDSVNRDMAALRAALNRALADRLVTTDFAWREPLKAYKNVSKRRGLYLDRDQRRRLISHGREDVAQFLRGLSMLPLRPGALAALAVEDFDSRLQVCGCAGEIGPIATCVK